MAQIARFKVLNSADVGATAAITSSSVPIDRSTGYVSIATIASSAGTAAAEVYYSVSSDNSNWTANTLAKASASGTYSIDTITPPVSKYLRVYAIGTSDNAPSTTLKAWVLFSE